jgi:hypothetical protein
MTDEIFEISENLFEIPKGRACVLNRMVKTPKVVLAEACHSVLVLRNREHEMQSCRLFGVETGAYDR